MSNMLTFSPELIGIPEFAGKVRFVPEAVCTPDPNSNRFDAPGLRSELHRMEPGSFLLIGENFETIPDDVERVHFSTVDGFEKTREASAQAVMFGELVLKTAGGLVYADHVALKPYDRPDDAAHELGAMLTVNSLGLRRDGPLSFVPLGFYRFEGGGYGLVTQYDPSVRTQDGIFWNPDMVPTDEHIFRALKLAGLSIGLAHGARLDHGDQQVKNTASDLRGPRLVDLTDMGPISPEGARADISTYMGSAVRIHDIDLREPVMEFFVPTYLRTISAPESRILAGEQIRPEEIAELVAR